MLLALLVAATIDSIAPSQGPIAGGTIVTIRGSGFTGAGVTLDQHAIAPLSQSDSELRLQMPAHDNGYAILGIGNTFGRFLYTPPRLQDLPPGSITTIAGIGAYGGDYGPATSAWFVVAIGMAFDPSGLLYFTDTNNNRVMRIRAGGTLEPFAESITFPRSIAFDSRGNLIVPDDDGFIWRIDSTGRREMVVQLEGDPSYIAVDADDTIYWQEYPSQRIQRIDRNGIMSTFVASGVVGQRFNDDGGLVFDRAGNLLAIDVPNKHIVRISRSGAVETIVGPSIEGHTLDNIRGIAIGPDNELFFSNAAELYKRASDGTITKLASGKRGFAEDGARLPAAAMGIFYSLLVDRDGNLLYSDADVSRIRKLDLATLQISTIAGSGPRIFGEGGPAIAAKVGITGLAFLPAGELLMSSLNGMFKIDAQGRLIRIAGSGVAGPLFDVPALNAQMGPASVAVSRDGTIDFAGGWIARIDPDGIVRRTTGKPGECGFDGDGGDALGALLCQAWDAVRDRNGNLFIADTNNNRIRRIDAGTHVITTFAGSGPVNGLEHYGAGSYCGDGGAASEACINTPYGVTFDDRDNLLICGGGGIRKVSGGIITTLARSPCTKMTWAFGNLFTVAADHVARISRSGAITALTAAGDGFSGDGGPASLAHMNAHTQGEGIVADAEGNLFFNDGNNLRLRAIRYGAVLAPPNATVQMTKSGSVIRASVFDGATPAEGVRVDFTVPGSGASCTLSNPFAITDANGVAAVVCTPNCIAGTYNVAAQPLNAATSATVSMTNGAPQQPCRQRAVRH